jgi:large subunit ribosomal protein L3
MQGLIGKKIGMTQVWDDNGVAVPVTVVEIGPCPVVQVKTVETDGYVAAQLGFVPQKAQRLSKAARTRFEKAGVEAQKILAEFTPDCADEVKAGDVITAAALEGVAYVDVQATTKGRGFAGVVRRFKFAGVLTATVVTPSVVPAVSQLATSPAGLKKARRCPDTWAAWFAPPRTSAWSN